MKRYFVILAVLFVISPVWMPNSVFGHDNDSVTASQEEESALTTSTMEEDAQDNTEGNQDATNTDELSNSSKQSGHGMDMDGTTSSEQGDAEGMVSPYNDNDSHGDGMNEEGANNMQDADHDETTPDTTQNNQGDDMSKGDKEKDAKDNEHMQEGKDGKESPKSEVAREHMSEVAKKVEELLELEAEGKDANAGNKSNVDEDEKGLDEKTVVSQIHFVAKAQKETQAKMEEDLKKLESRSPVIKFLIGPDKNAIESLRREMEMNEIRVKHLQALQSQANDETKKQVIKETILAIINENVALQEQILQEEQSFSLFGWLVDLFS